MNIAAALAVHTQEQLQHIPKIPMQEQDHQIALATALGIDTPNLLKTAKKSAKKR